MTVIPDAIEPLVLHRWWLLMDDGLHSLNHELWKPGEAMQASCMKVVAYHWQIVRGPGWTREEAADLVKQHKARRKEGGGFLWSPAGTVWGKDPYDYLEEPNVEPPPCYAYTLASERLDHAPDQDCSCGIYAADPETAAAYQPDTKYAQDTQGVMGTVSLWGKVIPGENGARAEYAYPASFTVPAELADDPRLVAFGVPITVAPPFAADPPEAAAGALSGALSGTFPNPGVHLAFESGAWRKRWREQRLLGLALGASLACVAAEVGLILARML